MSQIIIKVAWKSVIFDSKVPQKNVRREFVSTYNIFIIK